MKKENIGYLIAGMTFFMMISMTITDASKDKRFKADKGVVLSVPARPIATVYVAGTAEMYRYIKKGYQVQSVVGSGPGGTTNTTNTEYHMFLMVKY